MSPNGALFLPLIMIAFNVIVSFFYCSSFQLKFSMSLSLLILQLLL